ncbi:sugar transferase [uncultured Tateyamaria sp.]|uniref:sugar transferase n=1 Tax=uncultured Tateyamaria sp. TaxID=455651 RepID=UPI002638BAB9|nr:sugar transferase [uncultured Tateyamaria sp.]
MAHLDLLSDPHASIRTLGARHLYRRIGKRALDLTLTVILLPALLPIIAVLVLLVRRDGSAGLFAHTRVGRHGQTFACWKIRTMLPDAEARLEHHLNTDPVARAEWHRTQKLENDPRITRLGHLLRRTSLDELPQIWNVLRGDMSFVGPRPVTLPELERYGPHSHVYLSLKPGITGLWQVTARANGCYTQRLHLDQTYEQRISLLQDLGLIARTALVVVRPTGR